MDIAYTQDVLERLVKEADISKEKAEAVFKNNIDYLVNLVEYPKTVAVILPILGRIYLQHRNIRFIKKKCDKRYKSYQKTMGILNEKDELFKELRSSYFENNNNFKYHFTLRNPLNNFLSGKKKISEIQAKQNNEE